MIAWLAKKAIQRYLTEENIRLGIEATAIGLKRYFSSPVNRKVCLDAVMVFASHFATELMKVAVAPATTHEK